MYILLSLNSNVSLIQLLIAKLEKGGKHMPPEEKDKIMQVHVLQHSRTEASLWIIPLTSEMTDLHMYVLCTNELV